MKEKKEDSKRTTRPWFSEACLWIGRVLVIALLAYLPWFFGMVTWGQQILLLPWMTAILAMTWLYLITTRGIRISLNPLLVCLLILLLLAFVQILPLPDSIYQSLSPVAKFEAASVERAAEYLGISTNDPELVKIATKTGPFQKAISICPVQTRASLVGFTSAIIMILCSSVLFCDRVGRMLLLASMGLISTVVATIGVMQSVSWNQWSLVGQTAVTGFATFVSRNSAPQYMAVGIGCTIAFVMAWLAQKRRKSRQSKRYRANTWVTRIRYAVEDSFREIDAVVILVTVAMVIQIAGVIGAASRGGFVSLFFALCVTLLLTLGRSRKFQLSGMAGAGVLAVFVLLFANSMELNDEIYSRLDIERLDSPIRLEFWKLALGQSEFWLTGCGLGNFHFAIMHANIQHPVWIYHAESIFVELVSELGIPGFVIALVGLVWLSGQILKRQLSRSTRIWPAAIYSICAITLHSLVDFSLIIPAVFLSLGAVVGAFLGELQHGSTDEQGRPMGNSLTNKRRLLPSMLFLGLGFSLWQGAYPLLGFAQAEKLEQEDWEGGAQSTVISRIMPVELDLSHPEVVLQLAKQKSKLMEDRILNSLSWPEDVTPKEKSDFSRLEFVNAILRSPDDSRWEKLKKLWSNDQALIRSMAAAESGFGYATRHCMYDWRGQWGQYRTNSSSNSVNFDIQHALICARLQLLTNSMPSMQQAVGTCELLAMNRAVGLRFWKDCLDNHPLQTYKLAVLVNDMIEFEELQSIVPSGQIPNTVLCRTLVQNSKTRNVGVQLLDSIEIDKAIEEASSEFDWNVVSWLAQSRDDTESLIGALRKLAALKPMDKAVRIRLAKALETTGQIEEAIQILEQANRRTALSPSEELLLERLRTMRLHPPSGAIGFTD